MAISTTDPKHQFKHSVTGNADARRNSLIGGGPCKINPVHWMVTALPGLAPDDGAGMHDFSMHLYENIFLQVFLWDDTLMDRNFAWYLLLLKGTRLLALLDAASQLEWRAFDSVELVVQHLTEGRKTLAWTSRRLTTATSTRTRRPPPRSLNYF